MTLDELVTWAENHGIPGDKHLGFGVATCGPKAVRFDLAHDTLVLMPAHEVNSKIRNVCIECRCTPTAAREVLEDSNWNIPLAITTYLRISHGNQDPNQARLEAHRHAEEGTGQGSEKGSLEEP